MAAYVLRYSGYLDDITIDDFPDREAAKPFVDALEKSPKDFAMFVIDGPGDLRFGSTFRNDLFELLDGERRENEFVSREHLFNRIESWVKE